MEMRRVRRVRRSRKQKTYMNKKGFLGKNFPNIPIKYTLVTEDYTDEEEYFEDVQVFKNK